MQNLLARAHLPAVKFSPRAFMGCGGWDLAQAPPTVAASMDALDEQIPTRASRSFSRPRRSMGCGQGGFPSMPTELVEPDEKQLSCGGGGGDPGGYMPEFLKDKEDELSGPSMGCGCSVRADEEAGEPAGPIVTLKPGLSGPRVHMGCGDEPCEECAKAAAAAGMGCTKCKRIRQRAMDNDLDAMRQLGQAAPSGLPDTSILVVSGLTVAGLFYLATR